MASTIFRVDGMIAVITGGGTGIGLIMARALADAGATKVYILGRRKDVLEEAASNNPVLTPLVCDVTSKESLQSVVDTITRDTGFVNLLVANSGVLGPQNRWDLSLPLKEVRKAQFEDVSMEEFTQTFHVNVTGAYFTMLAFLELLDAGNQNALKGGFGAPTNEESTVPLIQSQVIFTSSISAFGRAAVSPPTYAGSKAAITHLGKHASTHLARYRIRSNVLAPGLFPSELADLTRSRNPESEPHDHPLFIPAQRFGGDAEMAGTILYLASRAGSYVNGSVTVFDGGRSAVMNSSY